MKERANVLVTEVFDTELIGEGAIGTFNHAHKHLLTVKNKNTVWHFEIEQVNKGPVCVFFQQDSVVIPARATIFVQLVESEALISWNRCKPLKINDHLIHPPNDVRICPGNGAVHDIQLAQLDQTNFRVLTDPTPVFL